MTPAQAIRALADDPPIDVKIYAKHLRQQLDRDLHQGADRATLRDRSTGDPVFVVGHEVRVWTRGRDGGSDRWVLGLER